MSIFDAEVDEVVSRGASWLDEHHPGWTARISLDELMMNNCTKCVIGQGVGDYYETIAEASAREDSSETAWAIAHGFCAPDCWDAERHRYDQEAETRYYGNLEVRWTEEVWNRLS